MPPKVKAKVDWNRADAKTVVSTGRNVISGMGSGMGPTLFPAPPVSIETLRSMVDNLDALVTEAFDGSRKVIAQRNKQRDIVVRMLERDAHYVEDNCDDDIANFLISGFRPRATTKNSPQPLLPAKIKSITYGNTGETEIALEWQGKAVLHYEVRVGAVGPGGTSPATWTMEPVTKGQRRSFKIGNLTPGTIYAFQARALGPLGYTEWTDSTTKMAT
jgi:hypothetical protein